MILLKKNYLGLKWSQSARVPFLLLDIKLSYLCYCNCGFRFGNLSNFSLCFLKNQVLCDFGNFSSLFTGKLWFGLKFGIPSIWVSTARLRSVLISFDPSTRQLPSGTNLNWNPWEANIEQSLVILMLHDLCLAVWAFLRH